MKFIFTYNISLVWWEIIFRSSHWRSQNPLENICAWVTFLIKLQAEGLQLYWKRDSCTGVFTCEIFKNIFCIEHLWTTASETSNTKAWFPLWTNVKQRDIRWNNFSGLRLHYEFTYFILVHFLVKFQFNKVYYMKVDLQNFRYQRLKNIKMMTF